MEKLTVQILQDKYTELGNMYQAIEFVRNSFRMTYPTSPEKPKPIKTLNLLTASELKEYSKQLESYELDLEVCEKLKKGFRDHENEVNSIIEDFLKEESGLNSSVPEEYRSKIWSKAWEYGHSNGYSEVYNYLLEVVDIFE